MSREVAEAYALRVFRSQLSALDSYLRDDSVQEVMVNASADVWIERNGVMEPVKGIEISDVQMRAAVKALAGSNGKDVAPVLDCRMTGFRIAAALQPVGIKGNALCIRKHARSRRVLDDYLTGGSFEVVDDVFESGLQERRPDEDAVAKGGEAVRDFLKWIVCAKKNILIAGSTGSGKTTFINALLAEIPHDERVLTIEDTAELQVQTPNYVGFECTEGVTVRNLVRLSLRFRPDRVVVGEIRGAEAYDLLDVLNTGHSGGMCSMHADSPALALARLESMVRMNPDATNLPLSALRMQIANTFQYIVYCSHFRERRGPDEIVEVLGVDKDGEYELKPVFNRKRKIS